MKKKGFLVTTEARATEVVMTTNVPHLKQVNNIKNVDWIRAGMKLKY